MIFSLQNLKFDHERAHSRNPLGIGFEHEQKFSFTRKLNFPHLSLVCIRGNSVPWSDQNYISRTILKSVGVAGCIQSIGCAITCKEKFKFRRAAYFGIDRLDMARCTLLKRIWIGSSVDKDFHYLVIWVSIVACEVTEVSMGEIGVNRSPQKNVVRCLFSCRRRSWKGMFIRLNARSNVGTMS